MTLQETKLTSELLHGQDESFYLCFERDEV